jgi:integrase
MPTNTLTDACCKAAKARDAAYKLFDGGGLHLFVSPTGSKTWRLAYRIAGKPKTISFGAYPAVTLAIAREKREAAKAQIREGVDPMVARQLARRPAMSLAEASAIYWNGRQDVTEDYRKNAMRAIESHLLPFIGDRDVSAINREDLLACLKKMDAAGLLVYVRKVRMWVGQVLDWAVENGYARINPAELINPRKAFGHAEINHFAALDPHEMPEFMYRLSFEKDLLSVVALKVMLYTWVRTIELRQMEWSQIDWDEELWVIPGKMMKRRKDHLVPLSKQAVQALKQMRERGLSDRYVFPLPGRRDRMMSENAVLALIGRMGYRGRMTGHGCRSTGSTWGNDNEYNADAIERQLAHVPENKTRAAYNRAKYFVLRRQMLQDWSDWLDVCARGSKPALASVE